MASLTESALKRWGGMDPFPEPPLIRLRYPVVLMHGFGMLAALRRGGMLHPAAMHLRSHGIWAYAPNVAPYDTVRARTVMWQARLEHILAETGAEKVNLIAHSMGGLDARYLISQMGMHPVVASLTTVATPHYGTALADIVLEQPDRLRSWVAGFADTVGAAALDEASADFLHAITELTPDYVCERFNPEVPDHPSVRYWSYAGQAGKGTAVSISPFLRPLNHYVFRRDGINDGFVGLERAKWGTFLGTLDADHTQQVGLAFTLGARFDANHFYHTHTTLLAASGF